MPERALRQRLRAAAKTAAASGRFEVFSLAPLLREAEAALARHDMAVPAERKAS